MGSPVEDGRPNMAHPVPDGNDLGDDMHMDEVES